MHEPGELRIPTTWDVILDYLRPRRYTLTRYVVLRLLGIVYVFAFLGLIYQGPALLGSHGLTPVASLVDRLHEAGKSFWDVPSMFLWDASDTSLTVWAWVGLVLSIAVAAGYANMPMLLALWWIYGSYERVGQLWFGFGWEMQLLETTLIAAFLAHPWDPRPLRAEPPPTISIVMMRWLVFRIMLGAGLIKWRGADCWHDLTCLDWHFETQPNPNPLSAWFHHLPHWAHAVGVTFNHVVELMLPWVVFGPRPLRLVAAIGMASFQLVLIASGNLAFLNWLTLVPVLALFDDDALLSMLPKRARGWLEPRIPEAPRRNGWQLIAAFATGGWLALAVHKLTASFGWGVLVGLCAVPVVWVIWKVVRSRAPIDGIQLFACAFAGLVAYKSLPVIDNLIAYHQRQAMNQSFDKLSLVNTYGAFGSVDEVRHELVIEGTMADDPNAPDADWRAYELPCKPGDVKRRPCVLGPYHLRLDWLIWFSAMEDVPRDPWIVHLVWKLLDGDRTVRQLIAIDPFDGKPPKWVRIRRFVYHLQPLGADTWWTRDSEQLWLPPVSRDTEALRQALQQYGWPSPSEHD